MRKTTGALPLVAAAWLAATGCAPDDRSEELQTAGFTSGGQLRAGVAGDAHVVATLPHGAGFQLDKDGMCVPVR